VILNRAIGLAPQAVTGEGGEGAVQIQVSWRRPEEIDITPKPVLLEGKGVEDA
jgi:hypothetical protein